MFDISSRIVWKLTKLVVKIAIILVIVFGILFWVLSSLGGDSDTLKIALQDYASERLPGYEVEINTLKKMSFFPYIGFDVADIEVGTGTVAPALSLERGQAAIAFWDMASGSGRISSFHLENLQSRAGFLHAKPVLVRRAAILEREEKASFDVNGQLGAHVFFLSFPLKKYGGRYAFPAERAFTGRVRDIDIEGVSKTGDADTIIIDSFAIARGDVALAGKVARAKTVDGAVIQGALSPREGQGQVAIDLRLNSASDIGGEIVLTGFAEEEAAKARALITDLISFWVEGTTLAEELIVIQE